MDNDLLSQLHDIKGIDNVSWWPLAPGWYGLIVLCLIVFAAFFYLLQKRKKRQSRRAVFDRLRQETDAKRKIAALSELLRRLAVKKHGRQTCAGLEGQNWLNWLSDNDPNGYDWTRHGEILLDLPYAPKDKISNIDLDPLIDAAEGWVS